MEKLKARTATIVVAEADANIFNLMRSALGCTSEELFQEMLELHSQRFKERLDDRSKAYLNMIGRAKNERDIVASYEAEVAVHPSTQAKVTIRKEVPA